jgi:pyruvate/2-oxoacid:ferredoxin oxidoreductase alpha subunit
MSLDLITANHAAGMAATLAGRANRRGRGFGSGVYPITPQTESIELLCKQTIDKGHVVRVESEHSAMAACIGFSIAGLRSFTASSSNGLLYMTENVFSAAMYRLPIVMMAVNRTIGPPWNIWADHGDTLSLRDAGWVQIYCEDNQDVFDSVLAAFRLGEDRRVLLPVMVCQDAFVLSHTMMLTEVPDQDAVDGFLPPLELPHRVSSHPITVGTLDYPRETEVHRRQLLEAMGRVPEVWRDVQQDFRRSFGRGLGDAIVPYRMEDAEVVLVSMGTMAATARRTVDAARERGIAAGALQLRMFRPLPEAALTAALARARRIAVLDRNVCPGFGGIVWGELRGLVPREAILQDYLVGIGGGDVRPHHLGEVIDDILGRREAGAPVLKEVG